MSDSNVAQLKQQEAQRRISKAQLLRPRIHEHEVEIESLGGSVLIRTMSHETRQRVREEAGFQTENWDEERFTMLSIVNSVIDPELTEDDIEELKKTSAAVIDELVYHITMLNMMGEAVELKKGSSETQN